jgi:hypothetical protein
MFFCISSAVDELSSMTRSDSMGRFNLPNSNYINSNYQLFTLFAADTFYKLLYNIFSSDSGARLRNLPRNLLAPNELAYYFLKCEF